MTRQRTIVITGASSGIGRATADMARTRCWRVLGTSRTDAGLDRIRDAGCEAVRLDLTEGASIAAFGDAVQRWCGGALDGLVNNAGILVPSPIELLSDADLDLQFQVNLFGQVSVTKRLLPMLRAAHGHIVFVSSVFATLAVPVNGAYVASKIALEAIADTLRVELEPQEVGVSVLRLDAHASNTRVDIAKRLALLRETETPYSPMIERAAQSLGKPPLRPSEAAAKDILALFDSDSPPFLSVAPQTSYGRVIDRHAAQLTELQRQQKTPDQP